MSCSKRPRRRAPRRRRSSDVVKPHPLAVLLLIAAPALAADLGKYAAWGESPAAYFMTQSERAAWGQVRNEEEAAAFVKRFDERRAPDFEHEVAERTREVDERLTFGATPASHTLRGKIVILLGAPTSCSIRQRKKVLREFGSRDFHPGRVSRDILASSEQRDIDISSTTDYVLTYAKAKLPGVAAKDEVIVVHLDPASGVDFIDDTRTARRVKELMNAAAEASVVSSAREQRR